MEKRKLVVAEVFSSIQGEGQTMGVPSVFLRLGGCNLLCQSKDWVCDTIEVWKNGKAKSFVDVLPKECVDNIVKKNFHLVVTGGEPLMQQVALKRYLQWFRGAYNFNPIVEIETNGTIVPDKELINYIRYWNISPKLPNSGETFEKRVNGSALMTIMQYVSREKYIYKFVVSHAGDVLDILQDYDGLIYLKNVVLMPAGDSRELLEKVRPAVAELAIQNGWRYSDRLHIGIWNQKTGV